MSGHRRRVGARLAWFEDQPDEAYWTAYWRRQLTDDYYDRARAMARDGSVTGRLVHSIAAPGDSVLEAGCGLGWWVAALTAQGLHAEGLEYADDITELARGHDPTVDVRTGDALAIDRPDGHYDGYLSLGVIEHRREGPEPFLAEAARVIRPGGWAVVSVPHFGPVRRTCSRLGRRMRPVTDEPFFQYGFQTDELVALIEAHGFSVTDVAYDGVNRLLVEEVPAYGWTQTVRGARLVRATAERLVGERDGHMVMVAARRT